MYVPLTVDRSSSTLRVLCVHMCAHACVLYVCRGLQRPEGVLNPLELELQVVMSHVMWVLRTKPWSSARRARALLAGEAAPALAALNLKVMQSSSLCSLMVQAFFLPGNSLRISLAEAEGTTRQTRLCPVPLPPPPEVLWQEVSGYLSVGQKAVCERRNEL